MESAGFLNTWALSGCFSVKNNYGITGNSFDVPEFPANSGVPSLNIVPYLKPYGFCSYIPPKVPELIQGNVVLGHLDDRVLKGLEALLSGECAIHSNQYALTVKNGSIEVYREDGFKAHTTVAQNAKTIVKTIFTYLMTMSSQLNALSNSFKTHTHQVDNIQGGNESRTTSDASTQGQSPPIDYFTSASAAYPGLVQGNTWNDADQMFVKDSTNLLGA